VTESIDPWSLLMLGFGLMLIFEGILPFASPARWRSVFEQAARLTDGQLRFLGVVSMIVGCAVLLAVTS
jgi:uncharacterized protein YjeT (DUF2065 family)